MGVGFVSIANGQGRRNFVIPEKKDCGDKFGNIVQAKQEMGMTKEQQEEAKVTTALFYKINFLAQFLSQYYESFEFE